MNNERKIYIGIGVLIIIFLVIVLLQRFSSSTNTNMDLERNEVPQNVLENESRTAFMDTLYTWYIDETLLSRDTLPELGLVDPDSNMSRNLITSEQVVDIISFEDDVYGVIVHTECTAGGYCEYTTLFLVRDDQVTDHLVIAYNYSSSGDISYRTHDSNHDIFYLTTTLGGVDEFFVQQEKTMIYEQYRVNTQAGTFEKIEQ